MLLFKREASMKIVTRQLQFHFSITDIRKKKAGEPKLKQVKQMKHAEGSKH